jgi:predicted dithiol-disulfide oxidoreductase (DUF899 family)/uncharacterized protein YndB with AHSA1/START domain
MSNVTHTIRLQRVLRAPAERLYRAFLDPDAMAKWLPPHGFTGKVHEMDARVGGGYRMSFTHFGSGRSHSFGGRYVELTPHERIRYTDKFEDPAMPGEIQVAISLRKVDCGTELQSRAGGGALGDPDRELLPRVAGVTLAARAARRGGGSGVGAFGAPAGGTVSTTPFQAKSTEAPMNAVTDTLTPAEELARDNPVRIPNESAVYRRARTALLAEEIELRRHIERVAAQRRALPPGGDVDGDYRFKGEDGRETDFAGLFGDKDTLVAYSYMFGPQRERPCPMCTNLLGAWEGNAADIGQRVSLVVIARSPIEKLVAWKRERGWKNLRLHQDLNEAYSRDYFGLLPSGDEVPALNVFTRRDGTIRHFWSGEMTGQTVDPGQDPRGAPDPAPLWMVLDMTPEGRGKDWYPKLEYPA